jgi:hypothetical protein
MELQHSWSQADQVSRGLVSCGFSLGLEGIDKPEAQAKVVDQPSLALQACEALTGQSKANELPG